MISFNYRLLRRMAGKLGALESVRNMYKCAGVTSVNFSARSPSREGGSSLCRLMKMGPVF